MAQLDFYAQRRKLEHTDRWDTRPSRRPYPDAAPDFSTRPANPTDRDVHLVALHQTERVVHEDRVLVDGGETSRLGNLKRAIKENLALRQEMGTGVVVPSAQSQRYLDMDEPADSTGKEAQR